MRSVVHSDDYPAQPVQIGQARFLRAGLSRMPVSGREILRLRFQPAFVAL